MNSSSDNIYTALNVMQNKKVCIRALGRGVHSKNKLHSPAQADCNWKSINAFSMCLGRQMEAAHSTQVGPKHLNFCMDNWNITLLNGKKTGIGLRDRAVSS